jgi:hypothetical protein
MRRRSKTCHMVGASSVCVCPGLSAALILVFGCGGASARRGSADDDAAGGRAAGPAETAGTGAAAGAWGGGGGGAVGAEAGISGTGGSSEPVCVVDDTRCNAAFRREVCGAEGWTETTFVCARAVAVSDENGSYCVTKGDGSYRCWGEPVMSEALPADDYVRVQRANFGLIGLTDDGRLVAPNFLFPQDLPPVVAFSATNMWGNYAVCPRFADDSFVIMTNEYDFGGDLGARIRETVGPVLSAGCFFEGLATAVLADGTIWSRTPDAPPGSDFVGVTMSVGTFCAIQTSGNVACFEPYLGCVSVSGGPDCVGKELPQFPPGRYHSLTSTYDAVCAIDEQGALVCRRYDGAEMPVAGGPYVFAEAGRDVLCAIRRDGSTACFRQDGLYMMDVTAFVAVDPPVDAGW